MDNPIVSGHKMGHAVRMKGDLRPVMEIRVDDDGDTSRAMYTTEMHGVVYVLDAFKKKSKSGRARPKEDLDRIRERLKRAREHFNTLQG